MAATSLPAALLRRVIDFCVSDGEHGDANAAISRRYELLALSAVCRDWSRVARDAADEDGLVTSSDEGASMMPLERSRTKRLRVVAGPDGIPSADHVVTVLSETPHLESLNLLDCHWSAEDVARVVRAAIVASARLRSLLLPPVDDAPVVERVVLDGMREWEATGGLRQLCFAVRQLESPSQFLAAICDSCPQIECLDAAAACVVDLEAWERFCATCTQLRVLHWTLPPLPSAHLTVFGQYLKPCLMQLDLTIPHTLRHHEGDDSKEGDAGLESVLSACPNLAKLNLKLAWSHADSNHGGTQWRNNGHLLSPAFWARLACACPQLEELLLAHEDIDQELEALPLQGFTDAAVSSLAMLRFLKTLDVHPVNVSGTSLFSLLNSQHNVALGQREFLIWLGGPQDCDDTSFYDAIESFCECFLHHEPEALHFLSKKLVVHFASWNAEVLRSCVAVPYLRRLKRLLRAVRRKHPALRFRVHAAELRTHCFSQFFGFGVFTPTATPPAVWTHLPREALVDGVFIREEVLDEYGWASADCIDEPPGDDTESESGRNSFDEYSDDWKGEEA